MIFFACIILTLVELNIRFRFFSKRRLILNKDMMKYDKIKTVLLNKMFFDSRILLHLVKYSLTMFLTT